MDPQPILPSSADLARRALETTLDHSLHSLSLASLSNPSSSSSSNNTSLSSLASIEYPRSAPAAPLPHRGLGPHGTPRASARRVSAVSTAAGDSPASTEGHHVSRMTLADGVFARQLAGARRHGVGEWDEDEGDDGGRGGGSEFDPERSLGRLVGELGRVVGDKLPIRPTSPFSPRSPSPLPSFALPPQTGNPNLSFTLNRNDPLPSPPTSRSGSRSPDDDNKLRTKTKPSSDSRFSSLARELQGDIKKGRRVLSDSTAEVLNMPAAAPRRAGAAKDRVKALKGEGERRTSSAPARLMDGGDVTGMTGLLETPAKGGEYETLGRDGDVGGTVGASIPAVLSTLQARLRALETENSLSRRRVRELEAELDRARGEVDDARRGGEGRLREVIGEKSALEDLVASLRSNLARLTVDLETHRGLVEKLRKKTAPLPPSSPPRPRAHHVSVESELRSLRSDVDRLDGEVKRLNGIVEEGLDARRRGRGEGSMREGRDEEDVRRAERDVRRREERAPSRLRQGLHASAAQHVEEMPPTDRPPTRVVHHRPTPPASDDEDGMDSPTPASRVSSSSSGQGKPQRKDREDRTRSKKERSRQHHDKKQEEGPASPFPSIRAEDEHSFFAAMSPTRAPVPRRLTPPIPDLLTGDPPAIDRVGGDIPPQTVLARVVAELEGEFAHFKNVYRELAEEYLGLDATVEGGKRRIVAQGLGEVVGLLEEKAEQIQKLYSLLTYNGDRPLSASERERAKQGRGAKNVDEVMQLVREGLGEEGVRRLQGDGVGLVLGGKTGGAVRLGGRY